MRPSFRFPSFVFVCAERQHVRVGLGCRRDHRPLPERGRVQNPRGAGQVGPNAPRNRTGRMGVLVLHRRSRSVRPSTHARTPSPPARLTDMRSSTSKIKPPRSCRRRRLRGTTSGPQSARSRTYASPRRGWPRCAGESAGRPSRSASSRAAPLQLQLQLTRKRATATMRMRTRSQRRGSTTWARCSSGSAWRRSAHNGQADFTIVGTVGVMLTRALRLRVNDRADPYVAVYDPPEPSVVGDVVHFQWHGLLNPDFVQSILDCAVCVSFPPTPLLCWSL